MTTPRRVSRAKKTAATETKPNTNPQKVVTIQVSFIVSTGSDDTRSIAELRADLKAQMKASGAKNVTDVQGYYIIQHGKNFGRVCLPDDYDPKTKDFKPGRRPPMWASSPDEQRILKRITEEQGRDKLSRNPANLRTAEESKRFREEEAARKSRMEIPGAAMADFYENTERGREIMAEREAAMSQSRASASVADDEFEDFDEDDAVEEMADDIEEFEEEDGWEVEDIEDDDKMDDALESVTSKALAKVRSRKVVRRK